jgi:hypothetical protein
MAKFLSDEWFSKVKELTADAGEIAIPAPLKELTINLNVTGADGGTKNVHLTGGQFAQGSASAAPVTVSLPADIAKKIFIDLDPQAGMQAFMSGQMRVDGDVTKLMVLQSVQPSEQLRDLLDDIKEMTE